MAVLRSESTPSAPAGGGFAAHVLRGVLGLFAVLLLLSLLSYHPTDPHLFSSGQVSGGVHNWCGSVGATFAGLLQMAFGVGGYLVAFYAGWEAWPRDDRKWPGRVAWLALLLAAGAILGWCGSRNYVVDPTQSPMVLRWGGWWGSVLFPPLRASLGPVGLPLVLLPLVGLASLVLAPVLTEAFGRLLARFFGDRVWPLLKPMPSKVAEAGLKGFVGMVRRPFLGWGSKAADVPDLDAADARSLSDLDLMERQRESLLKAEMEAVALRKAGAVLRPEEVLPTIHSMRLDTGALLDLKPLDGAPEAPAPVKDGFLSPILAAAPPPPPPKPTVVEPKVEKDRFGREFVQQPLPLMEPTPAKPLPSMPLPPVPPAREPRAAAPAAMAEQVPSSHLDRDQLPPRRLFDPPAEHGRQDPALIEQHKEAILAKLAEFKIKGVITGAQPGPVVTVYEFQPDAGIPLSRILGMEEDLALALHAEAVRMDRIPGRNTVGIEIPSPKREVISFREVIDAPAFREPSTGLLTLALGKDMAGHPVTVDLAKMPHLLIGGSTGSGKSVGVNAMICSILLRALPSEAKLILIDPKMVEMGVYEEIPHLWAPVVTDMKEAGRVLKWVVAQMEDRYRRLALMSVRNLEQFNDKIREAGGRIDLSGRTPNPRWPERPNELEALPYVVVVIDELADLMMVARAEVEESIARIAQKARAVGIHLVLATQRPSVDIITGVIKANLPSRLSYRVNTKIDSRTILDGGGGEQLLGKGDALFLAPGAARPRRIHAPFLTEGETLRLVEWLKERGKPDYNQAL
ncbi:MAG TPA: DNA translocase FtsK 4TM domain-containing protein, partial [Holophagaceae bacterium]|nr:DNA translocase FtsK 4TM domain-containing protein [Holophagaceae bacterium]